MGLLLFILCIHGWIGVPPAYFVMVTAWSFLLLLSPLSLLSFFSVCSGVCLCLSGLLISISCLIQSPPISQLWQNCLNITRCQYSTHSALFCKLSRALFHPLAGLYSSRAILVSIGCWCFFPSLSLQLSLQFSIPLGVMICLGSSSSTLTCSWGGNQELLRCHLLIALCIREFEPYFEWTICGVC